MKVYNNSGQIKVVYKYLYPGVIQFKRYVGSYQFVDED